MTPTKYPQKSSYQKKIICLKTPKNIEIQKFDPKKNDPSLRMYKMSEYLSELFIMRVHYSVMGTMCTGILHAQIQIRKHPGKSQSCSQTIHSSVHPVQRPSENKWRIAAVVNYH